MSGYAVTVCNLSRRGARGVQLLDRVDLQLAPGTFTALVGASGAGKSTLLQAIAGLTLPDGGCVEYDGIDIHASFDRVREHVGYVPQRDAIHPHLSVMQTLTYAAELRRPHDSAEEIAAAISRAVSLVSIAHRAEAPVHRLSGGERKRLAVACELVGAPRVLLLDEPTSGLDPHLDLQLMQLFADIAAQGCTVILVTHAMEHLYLADSVVIMARGGRIAYDGPVAEAPAALGAASIVDCFRVIDSDELPVRPAARRAGTLPVLTDVPPPPPPPSRSLLRRWWTLTRRTFEVVAADRRTLWVLLIQAPLCALLLVAIAGEVHWADPGTSARKGLLVVFAAVTLATWLSLVASVGEIAKEHDVYHRERISVLDIGPYVLAKLTFVAVLSLLQALLLVGALALRTGLLGAGIFSSGTLELAVTLSLVGIAAGAMGLLASAAASSRDRALMLLMYLLAPQFLLSGVLFDLPQAIAGVSRTTITWWGVLAASGSANLCSYERPRVPTCTEALDFTVVREPEILFAQWGILALGVVVLTALTMLMLVRRNPRGRR